MGQETSLGFQIVAPVAAAGAVICAIYNIADFFLDDLPQYSWSKYIGSAPYFGPQTFTPGNSTSSRFYHLPLDARKAFESKGYYLVRNAIPRPLMLSLLEAASLLPPTMDCAGCFDDDYSSWRQDYRSPWLDIDLFRDLWYTSSLGHIAAQLLNASEIRLSFDQLRAIHRDTEQRGSDKFHLDKDILGPLDLPGQLPTSAYPLVRMWLPMYSADLIANETGGSIFMVPRDATPESCQHHGAHGSDHIRGMCEQELYSAEGTFDLHLGDVLFYSIATIHRTQPLFPTAPYPIRYALLGQLFDASRLVESMQALQGSPSKPEEEPLFFSWDSLCMWGYCLDDNWVCHYKELPSPWTKGLSNSSSSCFPQVFPKLLQHEKAARVTGKIRNLAGKDRLRRRLKQLFPTAKHVYRNLAKWWHGSSESFPKKAINDLGTNYNDELKGSK